MRTLTAAAALLFSSIACGPPSSARTAQRHLASGDYQAANRAADQAISEHPDDPTSRHVKIRALMAQGDLQGAASAYLDWHDRQDDHDHEALRIMAKSLLWQALQVPSEPSRVQAIQIVQRHELEDLAEPVLDLVAADSDWVAAAAAIAVLRAHPQAPQVAADLLASDDARARVIAVRGIARKVGARAREDLRARLTDPDASVRRAVAAALAGFHSEKDDADLRALAGDVDGQVRALALRGLSHASHGFSPDLVQTHLSDDYLGARLAAIDLLAQRGKKAADETLLTIAGGDDVPMALSAARYLAETHGDVALATLQRATESTNWSERASALNAVVEIAGREAALRLAGRAVLDARIEVRLTAARVLLRLGVSKRAEEELRRALASESVDARIQAATDLAKRGDPDAIMTLERMADKGPIASREAAVHAHALAKVATRGLVRALASDNIELRLAAADAVLSL